MARRSVIEREELFETANRLAAEGKDVTALVLLNALGGGSLTTIYKLLADWETGRSAAGSMARDEKIPEAVQHAFANTWRIAVMEAGRDVVAVKEKAAEDVRAAQKQFEEALEAIQKFEAESEADAAQIEDLKSRLAAMETSWRNAETDNAALKATNEQLMHQVKSQATQLDALHKDMEAGRKLHQEDMARLNAERGAAEEKSNTQIERLGEQVKTAIKEAAELKGLSDSLKTQNANLLDKLTDRSSGEKRKP